MRVVTLSGQLAAPLPRRRPSLGYLLVAPLVLWLLLTVIVPLIGAIGLSMQDMRIIGTPSNYVGLENYGRIIGDSAFWSAAGRSVVWVIGNALLQTALGFVVALLLNQRLRLARFARTWILLSWVIPTAVLVIIWRWMLSSAGGGLINALLLEARLIRLPISFFGSAESAMLTLIVINSWRWFPLTALFVLAGLQAIPEELYEAAKVDGASVLQRFRFITLPSLQPVLASLGLIGFLWSVNVFDVIWLLTQGGPSDGTTTLPVFIYNAAFKQYRLSEAAAASVVFGVLLLVCAALFLRFIGSPERER
ncbi:MAG: sugar ABC transporter permease [Anaerolineae bacterium]|nr:sugar ABC transporter permease [Anaerolineae bacterium]MDW8298581.1 sugar ABC transporter permease [Anaerolineae bacterium]